MLSHRVGAGRRFLTFVITFLSVLLIAPAAFAARVDVGARVVGLIVAGPTTITFGPPTYPGFFNLDVESEVRFDSSTSIFHYYYLLTDNTGADPVGSFAVAGEWLPESPGLDWGIVTGETSAGVWLDPPPGDIAFGATMTASFSDAPGAVVGGLHAGESITIYAQSLKPPALMPSAALGFLFAAGEAYAPVTEVPEPASGLLLGSGLFGLLARGARRGKIPPS